MVTERPAIRRKDHPEEGHTPIGSPAKRKHPVLFRQVDVFRPSRSREIQQVCPGNGCSSPPIGPARLEPVFSADGPQADQRLNIFAPRPGLLLPAIRPSVNENSALSGQRRKEEVTSRIVEKYGLEGGANDMKLLTFQTEKGLKTGVKTERGVLEIPDSVEAIVERGEAALRELADRVDRALRDGAEFLPEEA